MSYWIDDSAPVGRTSRKVVSFMADSDSDIPDLPTSSSEGVSQGDSTTHMKVARGSSCLSLGSGSLFILNSSDQWIEV